MITLPTDGQRSASGMELVALLRVVNSECFVIGNELTKSDILKIGQGAAYMERRIFEDKLEQLAATTQDLVIQKISSYDVNSSNPSFDRGFENLVQWYRDKTER